MTTWTTTAAAKLNLTLEVLGKRGDGFHDLASVVISLDLADEVSLTSGGAGRRIAYRNDDGRGVSIETRDDIIDRVWNALERHCPLPSGASIDVIKRIPVTGGLGGGSTDAAAFLRLARAAWRLDLSDDDLCAIGAEVGSDVPVCIMGGPMRMEGRGERLTALQVSDDALDGWKVLLHRPEIPVPEAKTATMYRSLRTTDYRTGDATAILASRMTAGRQPTQDDCVNSFDAPAREVMQGLTGAWRTMGAAIARASLASGADPVVPLLAGAGPTLFAVLRDDIASAAAESLRHPHGHPSDLRAASGFTYVASPIGRSQATAVRQL